MFNTYPMAYPWGQFLCMSTSNWNNYKLGWLSDLQLSHQWSGHYCRILNSVNIINNVVVSTGSLVTQPTFLTHMLTHHSEAYFSLCTLNVLTALSPTRRSTLAKSLYRSLASIYQHYLHRGNKKEGHGMVTVDKQRSASFDSLTPFFLYYLFPFSHVTSWTHTIQLHKEKHRSPSCMNSGW